MPRAMLSIVMPVFNHTEDLKTMLDSVIANSYQDWELLAVDDGSEEDTIAVLKMYEQKDSRISLIQRDRSPKGAPTCRNIGFESAKGDYIIFFDSDDYIAPYCLEQRVRELQSHPKLDFIVFRSGTYVDGTFHTEPGKNCFGYNIYKDDIAAFCSRTLPFVVVNNIYRRASLQKHNISWDTRLLSLQDAQFNLDCLMSGMRYQYSSCPADYGYGINTQGSVSKKILSKAHFDSNIYAIERFYMLIQDRFGHKYDNELLRGAMFVYVKISRTGLQPEFSNALASTILRFSPIRGKTFRLQVRLTALLCKFLPLTTARRLPILPYLMWYRNWEKWVVRKQKELP